MKKVEYIEGFKEQIAGSDNPQAIRNLWRRFENINFELFSVTQSERKELKAIYLNRLYELSRK